MFAGIVEVMFGGASGDVAGGNEYFA